MSLVVIEKSELSTLVENAVRRVISLNPVFPKPKPKNVRIGVNDVSDITGYTTNTIYSKVHKNTIPFHKSKNGGRKLIFFENEIRDWMKGKKETPQEAADRMEQEFNDRRANR